MKRAIALNGVLPTPEPAKRETKYRPRLQPAHEVDVTSFGDSLTQWVTTKNTTTNTAHASNITHVYGSGASAWPASTDVTSGITVEWKQGKKEP